MAKKCPFPPHVGTQCTEREPGPIGYVCNRKKGHEGPHHAEASKCLTTWSDWIEPKPRGCPADAHGNNEPNCRALKNGLICTRKPNHFGSHHAHGLGWHCILVWPQVARAEACLTVLPNTEENNKTRCFAEHPTDFLFCSLPKGHESKLHHAHSGHCREECLKVWKVKQEKGD